MRFWPRRKSPKQQDFGIYIEKDDDGRGYWSIYQKRTKIDYPHYLRGMLTQEEATKVAQQLIQEMAAHHGHTERYYIG